MNLLDAARAGAGLGEDEVTVCATERFARQTAVFHELEELGAVHVSAGLLTNQPVIGKRVLKNN